MDALLAQIARLSPEAAAFLASPFGVVVGVGGALVAFLTAVDAFFAKGRLVLQHLAWCFGQKARFFPAPRPDPHAELERLAKLEAHLDEPARARLGPIRAKLAADALAQLEKAHGAGAVEPEAQAAQREAVEVSAAEGGGADIAALERMAGGDVAGGLAALAAKARAEDAPHAERWRRLGAMAYPVNTALAAEAYAKALALGGSDPWDAIYLGRLHARAGDVAAALATAQAAMAALPETAARDRGVLHNEIGNALMAAGDREGALAAYRAAMAIAQDLAVRDPGNAAWARDLSVSHSKIGDALMAAGDRDGALDAYRAAMAIAQDLAARDPGNAAWARDLSISHNKIGDALTAAGDRDGALAAYRAAMAIREDLAARDPGNAEWARDLSVSQNKIGDALTAAGDREGALDAYRAAMAIAQDLAARDPGNAEWARDLWVSQWRLAGFEGSGVSWADVAASLEAMKARGVLAPPDEPYLEAARANAAARAAE